MRPIALLAGVDPAPPLFNFSLFWFTSSQGNNDHWRLFIACNTTTSSTRIVSFSPPKMKERYEDVYKPQPTDITRFHYSTTLN